MSEKPHSLLQKNVHKLFLNYGKQDAYLSGLASEGRDVFYEGKSFFLISGHNAFMRNAYVLMIKAAIPEIVYLPDWSSPSFYIVDTNLTTSQEISTKLDDWIGILIVILIFIITLGVIAIIWKKKQSSRL